ncbi:MAG TPA: hypothetical protein VI547_03495, partial [Anaerolineales bacterium]|nr:hypothetical protein [Anaerolineales bacterium]
MTSTLPSPVGDFTDGGGAGVGVTVTLPNVTLTRDSRHIRLGAARSNVVANQGEQKMNAQPSLENKIRHLPKGLLGGAILITLGVLSLVGQFVQAEWYGQFIMTALAVLFLVSGVVLRNIGLLIPGGILGGISLGVWV